MRDSVKIRSPLADAEDENEQGGKDEAAMSLRLTGLARYSVCPSTRDE